MYPPGEPHGSRFTVALVSWGQARIDGHFWMAPTKKQNENFKHQCGKKFFNP